MKSAVLLLVALLVAAPARAQIPPAPANLLANAKAARIRLRWTDRSGNERGFRVERSTQSANAGFAVVATAAANHPNYIDRAVTPGIQYFYRVRAFNDAGDSAVARITAPVSLQAPPVPGNFSLTVGVGAVTLAWVDGSDDETEYLVERKPVGNAAFQVVAVLDADTTTFVDDSVSAGAFRYRVRGRNMTLYGEYTAGLTARLDRPPSPTLSVTRSPSGDRQPWINLSWYVTGGVYSGFRVERSVGPLDQKFRTLAIVDADRFTYHDAQVEKSKVYYYRITALNDGAGDSDPSLIQVSRARAEPPYPYIKMPALEQWEITFDDGSIAKTLLVPDIGIAQLIYQVYLKQIDFLNFYPHSAVAKSPIGQFVPCQWGGQFNEMVALGAIYFPRALYRVFTQGLAAEEAAWLEGYKAAQSYIERMKVEVGAITQDELQALTHVRSTRFAGRFLPVSALQIDQFWYGDDRFLPAKEVVPIIGEKASDRPSHQADRITLYSAEYIRSLLEGSLRAHRSLAYSHAPNFSNLTNPLSESQIQALLGVRSADLKVQRFENWFRKLPLPVFAGDIWLRFYGFGYCPNNQTTFANWLGAEEHLFRTDQ